ncbi:SRPBCC family protein [Wenyingzhuangia sp. IMCC45533]
MKLETPIVHIQKSSVSVFNYLSDLQNFESMMPDNIEKFEADKDSFLFALSGMPEIRLLLKETTPHETIVFGAASGKLDFSLTFVLKAVAENNTKAQLFFDGKFNPMMAMMVKKPLTNFINTLSENLKRI